MTDAKILSGVRALDDLALDMSHPLEALRAEMDALDPKALRPINVDLKIAAGIALATALRIAPYRERVARLPEFRIENFTRLGAYAFGTWHAATLCLPNSERADALAANVVIARPLREQIVRSVRSLVDHWPLANPLLERVAPGRSQRDLGQDLCVLGMNMREHFADIDGKTPVTHEMLERAIEIGTNIVFEAAQTHPGEDHMNKALDDRVRAWTLLDVAYRDCARAIRYLRTYEGDYDQLVRSLHAKHVGHHRKKRGPEEAVAQGEPDAGGDANGSPGGGGEA